MKNNLCWKILAVLLLIWLYLFLWSNSIVIFQIESGHFKFNKLTGSIYAHGIEPGKWIKLPMKSK